MKVGPREILDRLEDIAAMGGSNRDPFICCDLVGQEELFEIQNKLATLMLDVAHAIGNGASEGLAKRFPYIYSTEES